MKIEYLEIKNYKQFADLTLDLTYPKGHEKEGEPLDKICIIGQSGTGKTNLLNLIVSIEEPYFSWNKDFFRENSKITSKYKMQGKTSLRLDLNKKYEDINIKKLNGEACYFIT